MPRSHQDADGGIEPIVKPKSRPRPPWRSGLLELVRREVLSEGDEDFVLKATLAVKLQSPEHEVGRCLQGLVEEGILMARCRIEPYDKDGDAVYVRHRTESLEWDDKARAWMATVYPAVRAYRSVRQSARRIRHRDGRKKVPYVLWDGTGHYVIRGTSVFKRACRAAELPEDPVNDPWTCAKCFTYNFGRDRRTTCKKCYASRHEKPAPAEKVEPRCPRCGGKVHYKMVAGKKRIDVRKCNVEIVRSVIES